MEQQTNENNGPDSMSYLFDDLGNINQASMKKYKDNGYTDQQATLSILIDAAKEEERALHKMWSEKHTYLTALKQKLESTMSEEQLLVVRGDKPPCFANVDCIMGCAWRKECGEQF